jgi:alpha-mannosidase
MTSPNPFLQLAPNRAVAALNRVRSLIWHNRIALTVEATEPTAAHRSLDTARRDKLAPVSANSAWGRLYDQRWCRLKLPSLHSRNAPTRYLEWRDQGEATLYIDGVPYYGFDVAHRYVALPPKTRELWIESLCCQSAIWHPDATGLSPRGSIFDGAFLVQRDDEAWAAYHDFQCLVDLMIHLRAQQEPTPPRILPPTGLQPSVAQATPLYRRLLRLLDEAVDAFDTAGLPALRSRLAAAFKELRDENPVVRAVLTGHAHIDLVWLWPERIGESKAVHTFATMNRLMALYPEFRFAYSQSASYEAVTRRSPPLMQAINRRIRSGQWEATGALYVESDTLMPCGEALARSFLLGQEDFKKLRDGKPARLLWLPDVFGYSACLPQLMRLAKVDWFFTTKLTWSAINRFPFSSFIWRGNDGSEVVSHVTQDSGYNNLVDFPRLHASANGHIQSDVHPEFLHPTGYGDGGGGTTEEMCERTRRLSSLAGTPAMSWDQPEAFFARLEKLKPRLPVYQGECYLEYHRGTFTTHGDLKAAFRGLERALQTREAAAVATGTAPDLTQPWRRLVFAQFHDYIPGSSVADVYAEGIPELLRLAREQSDASVTALACSAPRSVADWHAFNPLPLPWRGWVTAPDATNSPHWLELPPLSSAPLTPSSDRVPSRAPNASVKNRVLTSDRIRAEIDARGLLRNLTIDGHDIAFFAPTAQPILYPDTPANFESWDIDRHTLDLGEPVNTPVTLRIERTGSDRAILAVSRKLGRASTLMLRYILVAGEPVLRIEADLDWHEPHALLKLHFPTHYRGASARFGAPFGSVLRGQQPGTPVVEAQWEVPASRWAAVMLDGEREGLALITEAKYGFAARDGDLTVSLVRSPLITGEDDHRKAAPPALSRARAASPFTDQGRHTIRLAVGHYDSTGPQETHPAALADALFTTPLLYQGSPLTSGLLGIENSPTLIPTWAKPLDAHSWLLRLHEVAGQRGSAKLRLADGWTAVPCALDGSAPASARKIRQLPFRPYEIVSVKLTKNVRR